MKIRKSNEKLTGFGLFSKYKIKHTFENQELHRKMKIEETKKCDTFIDSYNRLLVTLSEPHIAVLILKDKTK